MLGIFTVSNLRPIIQSLFLSNNISASTAARGVKQLLNATFKMSSHTDAGPIAIAITESIKDGLQPVHLEVVNESYMHNVPKGSETHFKVLVVRNGCQLQLPFIIYLEMFHKSHPFLT